MTTEKTIEGRLADLGDEGRELVEFARRMVATPSLSGEEADVSKLLAVELERLGFRDVEVDHHGNVVGWLGQGPPRLMFNGHIDHVPPAGMEEPYEARLVDGSPFGVDDVVIRGRGSCDMKANVAAGAYAARFLDPAELDSGSFLFTADVQEETDSPVGVQSLLERGLTAEYGISSESTGLDVYLGHRGKIQVDVTVSGRSSHASTPGDGLNAVYRSIPFLEAFREFPEGLAGDPRFGQGTLTVTDITSEPGTDVAVVPSSCRIRLDRRYVPGETPEGCLAELSALVDRVSGEHGIEATVELVNIYPLMTIPEEHELVRLGVEAVRSVTGRDPAIKAWRFGVNGTFMSEAGIPTIGIGPGNENFAHTGDEHVPVGELVDSSRIYADLIRRLCAGGRS